jgi:hypothetical protein
VSSRGREPGWCCSIGGNFATKLSGLSSKLAAQVRSCLPGPESAVILLLAGNWHTAGTYGILSLRAILDLRPSILDVLLADARPDTAC